jgi:hypothetical protein
VCNFKIWQNRDTKIANLEIGVSKSKYFENRDTKTAIKPKKNKTLIVKLFDKKPILDIINYNMIGEVAFNYAS